jgi:hypothetical protein
MGKGQNIKNQNVESPKVDQKFKKYQNVESPKVDQKFEKYQSVESLICLIFKL